MDSGLSKTVAVKVPLEEWKRWKKAALDGEVTLQQLVLSAVDHWISPGLVTTPGLVERDEPVTLAVEEVVTPGPVVVNEPQDVAPAIEQLREKSPGYAKAAERALAARPFKGPYSKADQAGRGKK